MKQMRSMCASTQGWQPLMPLAPPIFQPDAFKYVQIMGAGKHAAYLDECYRVYVLGETESPRELGWQTPPTARIGVALTGTADAEWHLEPDELKF